MEENYIYDYKDLQITVGEDFKYKLEKYLTKKAIEHRIGFIGQGFIDFYGEENVEVKYSVVNNIVLFIQNLLSYGDITEYQLSDRIKRIDKAENKEECKEEVDYIMDNIDSISAFLSTKIDDKEQYYGGTVSVIVYFKELTIKNEREETTKIYDVFVKNIFSLRGRIITKFMLTKTTYTREQFIHGYIHSHVPKLCTEREQNALQFQSFCLGKGPIARTTAIHREKAFDKDSLLLYITEMDECLKVESLAGIPYIYMNKSKGEEAIALIPRIIKVYDEFGLDREDNAYKDIIKFVVFILKGDYIPFSIVNDRVLINMSGIKYVKLLSRLALIFINSKIELAESTGRTVDKTSLVRYMVKFFVQGYLKRDTVYGYKTGSLKNEAKIMKENFVFKGKVFNFKIIEDNKDKPESDYFLKMNIVNVITKLLLAYKNCNYVPSYNNKHYSN